MSDIGLESSSTDMSSDLSQDTASISEEDGSSVVQKNENSSKKKMKLYLIILSVSQVLSILVITSLVVGFLYYIYSVQPSESYINDEYRKKAEYRYPYMSLKSGKVEFRGYATLSKEMTDSSLYFSNNEEELMYLYKEDSQYTRVFEGVFDVECCTEDLLGDKEFNIRDRKKYDKYCYRCFSNVVFQYPTESLAEAELWIQQAFHTALGELTMVDGEPFDKKIRYVFPKLRKLTEIPHKYYACSGRCCGNPNVREWFEKYPDEEVFNPVFLSMHQDWEKRKLQAIISRGENPDFFDFEEPEPTMDDAEQFFINLKIEKEEECAENQILHHRGVVGTDPEQAALVFTEDVMENFCMYSEQLKAFSHVRVFDSICIPDPSTMECHLEVPEGGHIIRII